jgi:hypothetical protein
MVWLVAAGMGVSPVPETVRALARSDIVHQHVTGAASSDPVMVTRKRRMARRPRLPPKGDGSPPPAASPPRLNHATRGGHALASRCLACPRRCISGLVHVLSIGKLATAKRTTTCSRPTAGSTVSSGVEDYYLGGRDRRASGSAPGYGAQQPEARSTTSLSTYTLAGQHPVSGVRRGVAHVELRESRRRLCGAGRVCLAGVRRWRGAFALWQCASARGNAMRRACSRADRGCRDRVGVGPTSRATQSRSDSCLNLMDAIRGMNSRPPSSESSDFGRE